MIPHNQAKGWIFLNIFIQYKCQKSWCYSYIYKFFKLCTTMTSENYRGCKPSDLYMVLEVKPTLLISMFTSLSLAFSGMLFYQHQQIICLNKSNRSFEFDMHQQGLPTKKIVLHTTKEQGHSWMESLHVEYKRMPQLKSHDKCVCFLTYMKVRPCRKSE